MGPRRINQGFNLLTESPASRAQVAKSPLSSSTLHKDDEIAVHFCAARALELELGFSRKVSSFSAPVGEKRGDGNFCTCNVANRTARQLVQKICEIASSLLCRRRRRRFRPRGLWLTSKAEAGAASPTCVCANLGGRRRRRLLRLLTDSS